MKPSRNGVNRRDFLRTATGAVLMAGAGGLLGAEAEGTAYAQQKGGVAGSAPSLAKPQADSSFNPLQEKGMPRPWRYAASFEISQRFHPFFQKRFFLFSVLFFRRLDPVCRTHCLFLYLAFQKRFPFHTLVRNAKPGKNSRRNILHGGILAGERAA